MDDDEAGKRLNCYFLRLNSSPKILCPSCINTAPTRKKSNKAKIVTCVHVWRGMASGPNQTRNPGCVGDNVVLVLSCPWSQGFFLFFPLVMHIECEYVKKYPRDENFHHTHSKTMSHAILR